MEATLRIDDDWSLTPVRDGDREGYVAELNDPGIYEMTLRIPRPYALADADAWIAICRAQQQADGEPWSWVLRDRAGSVCGGIGYVGAPALGHKAEIGYWLSRRLWGRGLMPHVVRFFCDRAEREHGLCRITGNVFAHNPRSARVLQKSGFTLECIARSYYRKDDRIFDGHLYARCR